MQATRTEDFFEDVKNCATADAIMMYDMIFRMFGHASFNGEGSLWNKYVRGWEDAAEKEFNSTKTARDKIDNKVAEIFGKDTRYTNLYDMTHKTADYTLSFYDNYTPVEKKFTIGNLLYIYMVNKMIDGKLKLLRMGINDKKVAQIKENLDPRLIELADWIQGEFLPQTRERYNETSKLMYGFSMGYIPNYVPLNILTKATPMEDVLTGMSLENVGKLSTTTSAIKKRTINSSPIDLVNSDALLLIFDHVEEMEHWNAFAPLAKSLNMLLTDPLFRNSMMKMTTIYGEGEELWEKFKIICKIIVGDYNVRNYNREEHKKAVSWYKKSAELGHLQPQYGIFDFDYTQNGILSTIQKHLSNLGKKDEIGDACSQYKLGLNYFIGNGFEQSYTRAFYWWTKAAEQGDSMALHKLSLCYREGKGVLQNHLNAMFCELKALYYLNSFR